MNSLPVNIRGFHIAPHRIHAISDAAHKTVKLLLTHDICMSKAEMEVVLSIVKEIINVREAEKSND